MDKKASTDQENVSRSIFARFKKLSVLTRTPRQLLSASGEETSSSFPKGQLCRRFTIAEIRSATQGFNERLSIKKDRNAGMYKGTFDNGRTFVAIKKWDSGSSRGAKGFQVEVEMLPMLQHHNIVRLIGFCNDNKKMILVYEYMSNGSLSEHLHKHHTPLSWSQRLKICIGAAHAINYLHNGTHGQRVIHRNVTSSTILLDNNWEAKVTGLGLSIAIPRDSVSTPVTTDLVGTIGYIDPSYLATGQVSIKFDVFSFGVILLEVLCRRPAWSSIYDEEPSGFAVDWAQDSLKTRELGQIMDPDLKGQVSLKCLNDYARIVEWCLYTSPDTLYTSPDTRITMDEVVIGLESILALHERTDNSIPQMGITTSDQRLQRYFSAGQDSGGEYLRKDIKLFSGKFGNMTETNAIFGKSYQLEKFNPANEPNLLSRDKRKSLYDLMKLEYMQRADLLTRMKDFLHLLWVYPVKKEAHVNFGSLVDKFLLLNKYIKKSLYSSRDRNYLMEIQTILQDVEEHLDDAAFDIVAYLPQGLEQSRSVATVPNSRQLLSTSFGSDIVAYLPQGLEQSRSVATVPNSRQLLSTSFWSDIPEIHASIISSASHRALRCIKDLKIKKLGIWGSGAEKVAETLKDMPELRRVFDMVLCVRVSHLGLQGLLLNIREEIRLSREKISETGDKINVPDESLNCLLFVDYGNHLIDLHEVEFFLSNTFQTLQIVMTSGPQNVYFQVDLEIRIQDHFLPWILFSTNVDLATIDNYHSIQPMITRLVEECHGHLLAIILLARSLRGISAWELALRELASQQEPSSSELGVTSDVMVRVLRFIWSRMETVPQRCIIRYALDYKGGEFENSSLIDTWIRDGLVKGELEGQHVFDDLVRSFLLEQVGESCVRMRDETRVTLLTCFVPRAYGLHLKQDGSESNRMPNDKEWNAREIHLTNNTLSELPDSPNCPILVNLLLYSNQDLMDIPVTFFDHMPTLQVVNFSSTSIKHLPSSISKLTSLRQLIIRDCHLLMELPPEIGALKNLKVFDSEGTQLVYLPPQFGSLTKLECLKFSLYIYADRCKQINQIIPATALSKLIWLRELSICIDLYGEWWEDEAKLVIDVLSKLRTLKSLKLYFPNTELLRLFMEQQNWEGVPIYPHLSNFSFTVGRLQQRVLSRLPLDLDKMFVKLPKCLKYTNGEGDTEVISKALKHAHSLFLDRHWDIQSLSTFGAAEMKRLKYCLLSECNEMLEIINGSYFYEVGGIGSEGSFIGPILGSLEYLAIHHMKSLSCIWKGLIPSGCMVNLKTLVMNGCPELRTILTEGLLDNLTILEYLIVQDCTNVNSLISSGSSLSTSARFLPRLKKMSLLQLPELVSISDGRSIARQLESLVIYDCPNLEKLSHMEVCDDILEIKGENEWWDALKWSEPEWSGVRPDYLASVFKPFGTDDDIMDELADATNFLPQLSD